VSFQSPISSEPDAPVKSVILFVVPSTNAEEDHLLTLVVVHDAHAPVASVPTEGSTVI
jgi:hypothetical protein